MLLPKLRIKKSEWLSRKLWFSAFAVFMLYLGMKIAVDSPAFATIYSSFVGGVVTISGMFLAGNVIAGKLNIPKTLSLEATKEDK